MAILNFFKGVTTSGGPLPAQLITIALRDLYSIMEKGSTVHPIGLLQVLHLAFPRFAEKSEHGGFAQQVCIDCYLLPIICKYGFYN